MAIFDNLFLNYISLSSIIVTIFVLFLALFFASIKDKGEATIWLMLFFCAMILFYGPYISSAFYDPVFSFHRWGTVTFVLLSSVFLNQFFMAYPEKSHPKTQKIIGILQTILVLLWSAYFCYKTFNEDKIFKFSGNQWDFAADQLSKVTGLIIFANILIVYVIGFWRTIITKNYRWPLLGMTFSLIVATLVPGIFNVLSRDGALSRGVYQTALSFSIIIGFFSLTMIYINTTKDKTTFMAKIIGISFATFLVMLTPISNLALQDKEIAYDQIHKKDTRLVLKGSSNPNDKLYHLQFPVNDTQYTFKGKKPEGLPDGAVDLKSHRIELLNTYIYANIQQMSSDKNTSTQKGFESRFLQSLENINHPNFAGYKGLVLDINSGLTDQQIPENATRASAVLEILDSDFRKILTTYNKTRVLKNNTFRKAVIKKMSGVTEDKLIYPFARAILDHVEKSKSEGADLKAEVLEYLVLMQAPGSRHYRKHKINGQDPYIGFMQVDLKQGLVNEIGYSYFSYREFIHKAATKLFWILCAIVIIVLIGFRFFFSGALVSPLKDLLSGVTEVNAGDFDVHVPIKVEDEIGFLARSFNGMVSSIKDAQKKLKDYAENLEEKVKERTSELKKTLDNVQKLKNQQDGDYFLTSLLTRPLNENHYKSDRLDVQFLISQKKKFEFKNRKDEIGGDLCSAHRIELKNRHYLVFMNGDAMGKSIQGAGGVLVLGAVFESMIMRTQLSEAARNVYPERWLKNAFLELHKVFEAFEGSMLMSVVFGLVDEDTGFMYYLNAEHPYPVYYHNKKAEFMDPDILFRKLGTIGLGDGVHILTKQLHHGDVFITGSDGRDDILLGETEQGDRIINEDEEIFLTTVEEANGDLNRIAELLAATGELTDDLSFIRIEYIAPDQADEFALSNQAKALVKESRAHMKKSDWQGAMAILESIDLSNQNHFIVQKEKAGILYRLKKYDEALALVKEFTNHHPSDSDMMYLASVLYKRKRDLEQAADFGERFRLRDPVNADNLVNLADIYHHIGIAKRSRRMLGRALEADPNHKMGLKLKEKMGI